MDTPEPDAAMTRPAEDPREVRLRDRLEILLATLLGLAALATAFAAFQADLYGGDSLIRFNESVRSANEASQRTTEGNQALTRDVALFLEFVKAAQTERDQPIAQYLQTSIMDPNLRAAVEWWSDTGEDVTTPFVDENPAYKRPEFVEARRLEARSEQQFQEGIDLDNKGDSFMLHTVLFATALFLYGIASVSRQVRLKLALIGIGGTVFLIATGLLVTTYFAGPDLVS